MIHHIVSNLNTISGAGKSSGISRVSSTNHTRLTPEVVSSKISEAAKRNGQPSRSYSTSIRKPKSNKYSCDVTINGCIYSFSFPNLLELKSFYDSVKSA